MSRVRAKVPDEYDNCTTSDTATISASCRWEYSCVDQSSAYGKPGVVTAYTASMKEVSA